MFASIKGIIECSPRFLAPCSLLPALDDRIPDLTKSKQRFFPPFTFQVFETFFCFPVFCCGMEAGARFATLALLGFPFFEYAREFCGLATVTASEDATLNFLYLLGANYHNPVDLPDTTGLSWREGVYSGECTGPSQNQSAAVCGSPKPAVIHGSLKPAAVSGSLQPAIRGSMGPPGGLLSYHHVP